MLGLHCVIDQAFQAVQSCLYCFYGDALCNLLISGMSVEYIAVLIHKRHDVDTYQKVKTENWLSKPIWTSHTTNIEILQKIGVYTRNDIDDKQPENPKDVFYADHIMKNTPGHYGTLLRRIEGRRQGKQGKGRPR